MLASGETSGRPGRATTAYFFASSHRIHSRPSPRIWRRAPPPLPRIQYVTRKCHKNFVVMVFVAEGEGSTARDTAQLLLLAARGSLRRGLLGDRLLLRGALRLRGRFLRGALLLGRRLGFRGRLRGRPARGRRRRVAKGRSRRRRRTSWRRAWPQASPATSSRPVRRERLMARRRTTEDTGFHGLLGRLRGGFLGRRLLRRGPARKRVMGIT